MPAMSRQFAPPSNLHPSSVSERYVPPVPAVFPPLPPSIPARCLSDTSPLHPSSVSQRYVPLCRQCSLPSLHPSQLGVSAIRPPSIPARCLSDTSPSIPARCLSHTSLPSLHPSSVSQRYVPPCQQCSLNSLHPSSVSQRYVPPCRQCSLASLHLSSVSQRYVPPPSQLGVSVCASPCAYSVPGGWPNHHRRKVPLRGRRPGQGQLHLVQEQTGRAAYLVHQQRRGENEPFALSPAPVGTKKPDSLKKGMHAIAHGYLLVYCVMRVCKADACDNDSLCDRVLMLCVRCCPSLGGLVRTAAIRAPFVCLSVCGSVTPHASLFGQMGPAGAPLGGGSWGGGVAADLSVTSGLPPSWQ